MVFKETRMKVKMEMRNLATRLPIADIQIKRGVCFEPTTQGTRTEKREDWRIKDWEFVVASSLLVLTTVVDFLQKQFRTMKTKITLKRIAKIVNCPRTPPIRTHRIKPFITAISIHGKIHRIIIKKGGSGSEVSDSLIRKKALLAPQVTATVEMNMLLLWVVVILPVLKMIITWVIA